jgi:uncharacterized integral membrane protein
VDDVDEERTVTPAEEPRPESRSERTRRHARRTRIYGGTVLGVVLLGLLIAWVVANRDEVEVNWLVGSTDAALALVIFVAAAIGWLLGMATSAAIRRRTRRPPGRSP